MNLRGKESVIYWKLARFYKPFLSCLDNEYVTFDEISGDTVRMSYLDGCILAQLSLSDLTVCKLAEVVNVDREPSSSGLNHVVDEALSKMKRSRMVESFVR